MSKFFDPRLSSLKPYTPGEQPADMDRLIKLNTNENPFPPAPGVAAAVNSEVGRLRLYSDPECKRLTSALCKAYGVKPENVFCCNGSDEALAFAFQGLCPNGAAFADITYGFYTVFADLYGVSKKIVPLREDMSICVSDYAGLEQTVFIANPNAPTGIALPLSDIEALLLQNPDRLVVVDEAYVDFGAETALPLLEKYSNLLIVRTFSKSRSLAGARVGFALGSAEIIADLRALKYSFNPYNVNLMSEAAAVAALDDVEYFEKCRSLIIQSREILTDGLINAGFEVTESKANFIFARLPGFSGKDLFDTLRREGILVRRFDIPRIADRLRISIGTAEQSRKVIEVLTSARNGGKEQ